VTATETATETASARVLVVTWDGGGAALPALNLARRLLRAGHRAHVLGWVDQADAAAEGGIPFSAFPAIPPWPRGLSQDAGIERIFEHLTSEETRREIEATIDRWWPDVVVIDAMMAAAYDAAARSGRPTVVLCHFLASLFSGPWGEAVLGRPTIELLGSVDRVLALTRRELDADGAHACVTYVGPILRPGVDRTPAALASAGLPMLLERDAPWVLASLSTTLQNQPEMLPELLDRLGRLPARTLLTLGGAVDPGTVRAPANVEVRSFVPHELVLHHVDAFVSHAGLTGIATGLAHGVPLVCVPQGRDQGHNAARVSATGVGVETDVAGVTEAVDEVLRDPAYGAAAAAFRDPDSGALATRLVAGLGGSHA
jgi:UDP:flavonoid glycosyltransferase YjiC (YdhE family)